MQKITFLSRSEASKLDPQPGSIIISIHDNREAPASLQEGWMDRLTLCFDDADDAKSGLQMFDGDMAKRCVDFVDQRSDQATELVVHCQMGVSRSAGVALFFSELLGVPCFKGFLPVSALSYKIYNKHVYRTLSNSRLGDPMLPWRNS